MRIVKVDILSGRDKIGHAEFGEYFEEKKTMKIEGVGWNTTPSVGSKLTIRGKQPDGSIFAHDMTLSHETQGFTNCWFN